MDEFHRITNFNNLSKSKKRDASVFEKAIKRYRSSIKVWKNDLIDGK